MKARIPKSFDVLPRAQKETVAEFIRDTAKQIAATAYERGLRSTITLMVKMSCIILHEQYGFGKVRLMQFLTACSVSLHSLEKMVPQFMEKTPRYFARVGNQQKETMLNDSTGTE